MKNVRRDAGHTQLENSVTNNSNGLTLLELLVGDDVCIVDDKIEGSLVEWCIYNEKVLCSLFDSTDGFSRLTSFPTNRAGLSILGGTTGTHLANVLKDWLNGNDEYGFLYRMMFLSVWYKSPVCPSNLKFADAGIPSFIHVFLVCHLLGSIEYRFDTIDLPSHIIPFYAKTNAIYPSICVLLKLYNNIMSVLTELQDIIDFDDIFRENGANTEKCIAAAVKVLNQLFLSTAEQFKKSGMYGIIILTSSQVSQQLVSWSDITFEQSDNITQNKSVVAAQTNVNVSEEQHTSAIMIANVQQEEVDHNPNAQLNDMENNVDESDNYQLANIGNSLIVIVGQPAMIINAEELPNVMHQKVVVKHLTHKSNKHKVLSMIKVAIVKERVKVYSKCPRATFRIKNATIEWSYNFAESDVGNIGSLQTCPYTGRPYIYSACYSNSSWGGEFYISNCTNDNQITTDNKQFLSSTSTSTINTLGLDNNQTFNNPYSSMTIKQVANIPDFQPQNITDILIYLNHTPISSYNNSSNIVYITNLIDRVTHLSGYSNVTNKTQSGFYSIADKLLSSPSVQLQQAQETNGSIAKLLTTIESFSKTIKVPTTSVLNNFAISVINIDQNVSNPIMGFAIDKLSKKVDYVKMNTNLTNLSKSTFVTLNKNIIKILQTSIATSSQSTQIAFAIYDNHAAFNLPSINNKSQIISSVVSAVVDHNVYNNKTFTDVIQIHFYLPQKYPRNVQCVYLNVLPNSLAEWSTNGCHLINKTNDSVLCSCDHLTNFAVLTDIQLIPNVESLDVALSVISLIGLILSSFGLFITIITFILFKKLRKHYSQKSLLCLSINLLLSNLLFCIIAIKTRNELTTVPCIIIASLLHYFILSSFSWMLVMAIIQYLMFVKVFPSYTPNFTRKAAAFAQIVSLIPVIIVLAVDHRNYTTRKDNVCWLNQLPLYFAFILPVLIYIVLNGIIFFIVAHALLCGKASKQLRSTQVVETQRISRFTVALSCFIVSGLTWIFGFLTIGPVRYIFQILFCIFGTLTGFFIFLLYILTSRAKRTCWGDAFQKKISTIYSSSSSTAAFPGKDFSSSSISNYNKKHPTISSHNQQGLGIYNTMVRQQQPFIDAYMDDNLLSTPTHLLSPRATMNSTAYLNEDSIIPQAPVLHRLISSPYHQQSQGYPTTIGHHAWSPETNYIYETDHPQYPQNYSIYQAHQLLQNHDSTKL
ncbi:unnamed protein product [Didymodactylos carnosus]|uniref:Uncharacterized protein n=1 Tax=Didymodactylos carnosus TaxID=1234261 RepID=A0A813SED0_9BILA|nr:unnamed protein product [Didymodactylos carnosus]CAF0798172.1 unnamed protein product [Didymodactylos carnosus]CAF3496837.1 unnamed protein product [Didymodactylos carnosus]CAF3582989.1 unnamed protein product [Didymodactylos carnosus]